MAKLAPSLVACRAEVNVRWPDRDTSSDGWIGDAAHAGRKSDHNPGARDLVHALDIDEDLDGRNVEDGTELWAWLDSLRLARDPRIKYVIYEGRMFSSYAAHGVAAWTWRAYSGPNLHRRHGHVSIHETVAAEQDTRTWFPAAAAQPDPTTTTPDHEDDDTMREIIIDGTDRSAFLVGDMLVTADGKGRALRTKDAAGAGAFRAVALGKANSAQVAVVQAALDRARGAGAVAAEQRPDDRLVKVLERIEWRLEALRQVEEREETRDLAAGG